MNKSRMSLRTRFGAALLVLLLALPLVGTAFAETYAVVTGTNSLNLRAGASSSTQWLGAYPRGSWVTVTGGQNNFYAVYTADNKAGYMSKNFLSSTDQLVYGNVAIVNNQRETAFLNLRSFPSYAASVITILYNGVPLTILSNENGWYRVQMGDVVGYVRGEYTTISYQPIGTSVATIKTPNNTAVNMRTGPSTNTSVRKQFSGDRYVSVLYKGNGWWYVCIDRYVGFISSDFLVEGLHSARDNAADQDNGDGYAIVKNPISTQKLNLRQLPTTASNVVARLSNGFRLSVIVQGTEWCKVYADDLAATGYVMTKYIKLYNLPTTPKLTILHPQGSYVNMRSYPSMAATVLKRLPDKTKVTIIAPGPEWTEVLYNNMTGYVMNYFTSIAEAY